MRKIGILYGMENTFPVALVDRINAMRVEGVSAEHVQVGGIQMAAAFGVPCDCRPHLPRHSVLSRLSEKCRAHGTTVINNPFWWGADDKFFNYALASEIGVAVPPTVLLPHKSHPPGNHVAVHAQPDLSAQLGRNFRLHRLPGVSEAFQRRRLEERLQGGQSR